MLDVMSRAHPLPPDERRAALIAATIPLVREHGLTVTTRQIAAASGVAEGTIFRVFADKDALIQAAIESACNPALTVGELDGVDLDQPLRERLLAVTMILQRRMALIVGLMTAMRTTPPTGPPRRPPARSTFDPTYAAIARILEPDAADLRLSGLEIAHLLRLMTFGGSHPIISEGYLLSPEQIVSIVLDGVRNPDLSRPLASRR